MNRILYVLVSCVLACFLSIVLVVSSHAQSPNDRFDPNLNGTVSSLYVQSDGKILVGGGFGTISSVIHAGIARLNSNGSHDTSFIPEALGADVKAIAVQSDNKIIIGGVFAIMGDGTSRNNIARLNADSSLDTAFDPGTNNTVYALAVLPGGKILVGGQFTTIGGGSRNYIARLNSDGTLDTGFNLNMVGSSVRSIAVLPDGKIIIGGIFSEISGVPRYRLARLNADGSLDTGFNVIVNDAVEAIAFQADGKIIIGGQFTSVGGVTRYFIARLNSDGSVDTALNLSLNSVVLSIAVQTDGKIIIVGGFTTINSVTRNRVARLNADGSLDTGFDPNANNNVYAVAVQPDGKVLIGGNFITIGGVTRNYIARLNSDGSLDTTATADANTFVYGLAVQLDNKILIGGSFNSINSVTRNRVVRLNADGSLDTGFDPNASSSVYAVTVQPDGKILIGGDFTMVNGVVRNHIARLNSDGSLDTGFNPNAENAVYAIALQSDNKIIIAGSFTKVAGVIRYYIARLNINGTLDTAFKPYASGAVQTIALQPDGKILIGGLFTDVSGTVSNRIARLNSDGTVDTSFDFAVTGYVRAVAVQPDGKILVAGDCTDSWYGGTHNDIIRVSSTGVLEAGFNPNISQSDGVGVSSIALQTDGKILISGNFTTVGGATRNRIARLNSDGSLDATFDPNANNTVYGLLLQSDGKVIIGGEFTTVGGLARNRFARLLNTGPALQELTVTTNDVSTIQWKRSGTGPELVRAWFEQSADGLTWTTLGNAARISGGWELAGVGLPSGLNVYIRGRGIAAGGIYGASSSIIEMVKVFDIPAVLKEDSSVITINNDDDTTSKTAVTLTLNKAGAAKMRFMFSTTAWTAWETYSATKTITLQAGDGIKYVYVQFDNDTANIYYDSIILDGKPPVGTISINYGDPMTDKLNVTLALAAADDSDITEMCISPTATCPSLPTYNWETFNATKAFTIPGLATAYGTKTVYAKFRDKGGKVSTSVSDTISYVATAKLPSYLNNMTVVINGEDSVTARTLVTLTLINHGYTHMKFSNNGTTWTAYETFNTTKNYTLPTGDGNKIVYAKFKNGAVEDANVYGDDIVLDTKGPVGTVLINNGASVTNSRNVMLQLEAADLTNVAQMCFSTNGTTWSAYETYTKVKAITLPAGDGTKKVSVKFKDGLGNVSAIVYDSIILDTKAPVGKVTINAGLATTSSDTVKLTLAAPTAVFMILSLDGGVTWGDWEPFVLSKTVTLPAGAGTKTVKALFSDYIGNISATATDTITRNP